MDIKNINSKIIKSLQPIFENPIESALRIMSLTLALCGMILWYRYAGELDYICAMYLIAICVTPYELHHIFSPSEQIGMKISTSIYYNCMAVYLMVAVFGIPDISPYAAHGIWSISITIFMLLLKSFNNDVKTPPNTLICEIPLDDDNILYFENECLIRGISSNELIQKIYSHGIWTLYHTSSENTIAVVNRVTGEVVSTIDE